MGDDRRLTGQTNFFEDIRDRRTDETTRLTSERSHYAYPQVLTCGVKHPHGYDPKGVAQQE